MTPTATATAAPTHPSFPHAANPEPITASRGGALPESPLELLGLSPVDLAQLMALRAIYRHAPTFGVGLAFHHLIHARRAHRYDPAELPVGGARFDLPERGVRGRAWGTGDRTVLLVHGWEGHSAQLAGFVSPLVALGYRVVAFDAPGHGLSERGPADLRTYSEVLEEVFAYAGNVHGVVAHSCGAAATGFLLRRRPDLAPSRVALLAPMRSVRHHVEIFSRVTGLPAPLRALLVPRLERHLRAPIEISDATDVGANLSGCAGSGLILHDRHDLVIPFSASVAVARAWRAAELVPCEGLGHTRLLGDRAVIDRVARYMA